MTKITIDKKLFEDMAIAIEHYLRGLEFNEYRDNIVALDARVKMAKVLNQEPMKVGEMMDLLVDEIKLNSGLDLNVIRKLYPAHQNGFDFRVVGVSECLKGNERVLAIDLHKQFISFLVNSTLAETESYIIPATNHDNLHSLVLKIIKAGYTVINFAIRKEKDGKCIEYIYPDYKVEELWQGS